MKPSSTLVALSLLLLGACRHSGLPEPGSTKYANLCSAFYLGLAGLQAGEDVRAKEYLTQSTQIAPGEPAAWADLGILQVRQQQFDSALQSVTEARSLAPDNSRIEALLGLIESRRGNIPKAEEHLKKAIALDGKNLKAIYSLVELTEGNSAGRQGGGSEDTARQLLKSLLRQQPSNAAVLLENLRLAAKANDVGDAREILSALQLQSATWPQAAKEQFATVSDTFGKGNARAAAVNVQFLRNMLLRVPSYRESLDQIKLPNTLVAQPFTRFLRLPSPNSEPASADAGTRFETQPVSEVTGSGVSWAGTFVIDDQTAPGVAWVDRDAVHLSTGAALPLPGRADTKLSRNAVTGADLNYDFKTDLAIATPAGLKIYQQQDSKQFRDITKQATISEAVAHASYAGVWAFDIDLDGDLDLVLGTTQGDPLVLRNNGDGTFTSIHPLTGLDGLVGFATADFDNDGDPDIAALDRNGKLTIFSNERLGNYRRVGLPADMAGGIVDLATADINGDGALDLVVLKNDSSVSRLSLGETTGEWKSVTLAHADQSRAPTLFVADLDNNGALDLVVNEQVFLGDGKGFKPASAKFSGTAYAIADLNGDGRLDVLAERDNGQLTQLINHGDKHYDWQVIRTRAAHATGDQRINSFGIGGEIEVRSELLAQKQIITSPILHFGLGEHKSVQFARIVWPNGFVQAEFDLKADQTVLAEQRIKGSCPMLFVWNGKQMQFLKDVGPWGSALGLNVNAQGKGIYGTREWFNVPGDQLTPREGYYDLRITAEYWETYYMDHYSLLSIDHPSDSEVYTDERFALPPPTPGLVLTGVTHPFASAKDDTGQDVTAIVHDLDNRFLDNFGRGQYQGLTRDHWVELELPENVPLGGQLYLVGQGWIHDTDATIVKAQAQNPTAHPHGLSIEVADESGHWTTVRDGLGFPKGRLKTVVLDLTGVFRPGAPRRLRLRTNLELYWNKLAWGTGYNREQVKVQRIALSAADLKFRGFSLITQANASSPELPHYDDIKESDLRWRDQEGYATRYGDVTELLKNVDDRYVITSPGDELRMRFAALPPPAAGWKRDFVLVCDGWVKDGDLNSTFAGTVLPLPYHGMTDYVEPPSTLEKDRAYLLHPQDWQTYQTRYVTPRYFDRSLREH